MTRQTKVEIQLKQEKGERERKKEKGSSEKGHETVEKRKSNKEPQLKRKQLLRAIFDLVFITYLCVGSTPPPASTSVEQGKPTQATNLSEQTNACFINFLCKHSAHDR